MQFGLRAQLVSAGAVVLLAVTGVTFTLLDNAEQRLEEQAFDQLRSVRAAKANQIEAEIQQFIDNLGALADSRAAAELPEIIEAFGTLTEPVDSAGLEDYYATGFASRTDEFTPITAQTLIPTGDPAQVVQTLYIVDNPLAVGAKDGLDDANDGSDYSAFHKAVHPFFRSAQQSFGAYDIFLIDDETGNIVYSVFKEVDYGTSLQDGPYADSGLARVWRAARDADVQVVEDFSSYVPSYAAPAAFAAQGVYDPLGKRLGTIAMQAPIDRINNVMTSNEEWAEVGLGESGETYIVGDDGTMRNDSRFLIEDPEGFLDAVEEAGVPPETISQITAFDSTIGLLKVDTEGTRAALAGESDAAVFPDYRDIDVLSDYGPLELNGLSWVVMSEIDAAEAFRAANDMQRLSIIVLGTTGVGIFLAIWFMADRIVRPIRVVENETGIIKDVSFAAGEHYDTATLDKIGGRRDEIGDLATAFSRLVSSLEQNIGARVAVEGELNVAADIQRSLLPLTFPAAPDIFEFKMHAALVPANEVGGDFYDFGEVTRLNHFFLVGDVSGKGVPAALFMAGSKTLIRSGAMSGEPLDELMTRINAEIQESNTEFMFATVWIGMLDVRTGVVTFVNAGHNPPLIRRRDGSTEYVHETHGPFLGPVPDVVYTTGTLTLEPGDRIIVYSDGVTEAMDPDENLFGEDRLEAMDLPHNAAQATQAIVDNVLEWEKGTRSDDVTVLVLDFLRKREKRSLVIPVQERDPATAISRANERVEVYAEQHSVPADAMAKMQMAIDEIIMNVLTYGEADAMTIDMALVPGWLIATFTDTGRPFDPLSVPEPDTTVDLEDRDIGGLGIHLVRHMMDSAEYEYRDNCNILELKLAVPL